jgi:hypothetical protein
LVLTQQVGHCSLVVGFPAGHANGHADPTIDPNPEPSDARQPILPLSNPDKVLYTAGAENIPGGALPSTKELMEGFPKVEQSSPEPVNTPQPKEPTTGQPVIPVAGVDEPTIEKGIRVEAHDHPEVAAQDPNLLPQIARDELNIDKGAYDHDEDPLSEKEKQDGGPTFMSPTANQVPILKDGS